MGQRADVALGDGLESVNSPLQKDTDAAAQFQFYSLQFFCFFTPE
jgi:hypothetical protein